MLNSSVDRMNNLSLYRLKSDIVKNYIIYTGNYIIDETKQRHQPGRNQWTLGRLWVQSVFQANGAPNHIAKLTMECFSEMFLERLICRKAEVEWGPHSADLKYPDFLLWGSGFFKDIIYQVTLAPLKLSNHWRRREESTHDINNLSSSAFY